VANDQESVRELFNRQEFDGRPDIYAARIREPDFQLKGIFFTDSVHWKDQRRFVLRHLRDYGFGKRDTQFEIELQDELMSCIELIKNGAQYKHEEYLFIGDGVRCPDLFFGCMVNSFMKTVYGDRLPRADQALIYEMGRWGMHFQRNADDYGRLLSLIPWIRHIAPEKSGYKPIREGTFAVYNFIKRIVDRELNTYDEANDRHVIDLYIKEMRNPKHKENEFNNFLYDSLLMHFTDFLFPTLTAIGQQMAFLFQRLVTYPEVQERIQKEIETHVGAGRLPTLDDRPNLAYTEATVREILRHETLVPSSIPHRALVATEFLGYQVPKDTLMIPGLEAYHLSEDVWGDSYAFRPERFLDGDGKLSLKLDVSLPFGAGKRLCAGETFARNQMFLYTAGLLQNFTIKKPTNAEYFDESKNCTGLIRYIGGDFCVKFEAR
jgi:hypothetical protein